MKKILMVSCEGLGNGGIQHVMMQIVRNLSQEFHFDMLLFTDEVRCFDAEFQKYGTIFRVPKYKGPFVLRRKLDYFIRFPQIYREVKKILQENGPYGVIHCHNYFKAAPCLLAAKHCQVPVRISHSHNIFPKSHWISKILQCIYRKIINVSATCKIGCSQEAADYLFGKNTGGIAIPNAIDLQRFDISKYDVAKIKHSFIHVGRFGFQKNQLLLLDIFKLIQQHWPDATLKLVSPSENSYEHSLREKIIRLNLHHVEFIPGNADIPALLAQSEYMVFPSAFEGFGLALAEAQAMGVKCFASDVVPREVNIGLCQYLSLQQPLEEWAQAVFEAEKSAPGIPDTAKVSLPHYINQIRNIYNGEKL